MPLAPTAPARSPPEHELRPSEPRGSLVCLTREFAPRRAVLCDELGERDDRVAGDAHARGVVLPRVRLDQNGEAVTLREVPGREARRVHREEEARVGIVGHGEVRVEGQGERALGGESCDERIAHLAAGRVEPGVALIDRLGL